MNANVFRLSALVLTLVGAAPAPAQDAAQTARCERLQRAGVGATLTLFPVRLLGRPSGNVADALGLVLERQGMASIASASATFDAKDLAWEAVPAAFGALVKANAGSAGAAEGWSLYAEFLGDPQKGPTEVRFVVVDAAGELVLNDRQTAADATFRRTAGADPDPLGCATCVGERLFELAGWKKVPGGVRDGRFSAMWEKKSGVPDRKAREAMQQRAQALRGGLGTATFAVLAPSWHRAEDVDVTRFAAAVQQGLACKEAKPLAVSVAVSPSPNQQKRLYDLAGLVKAQLAKAPIAADYAIAVDCGFDVEGKSGYSNVVVVTQAGDLVLAEFQNDQHPLFRQHAPKTLADGERLAVAMLARALR